jgi:hypothetical protein
MQQYIYLCKLNEISMEKKERTVIHLELNGSHFYFGSLKAMTVDYKKEVIGIEYSSLRNYGLTENKPYQNSKCIIRKGVLKAIEGGRGQSKEKSE